MVSEKHQLIKLIKPYITFDEVQAEFEEVFQTGWFTKGKFVQAFRETIKEYTGAQYAHLATSATTALTIALKAVDIKSGDEVIVSDFSYPATANVVEDLGATPIFADVSLQTFNMLPTELSKKITAKTKAVIFVDALGNPSGIHEIKSICSKFGIPLIEDAACAIGSSENGVKCGNIADITCFSFHPRKLITTGEGGAITFNDERYQDFFEVKLNHGAKLENEKMNFVDYGYNYRLPELQAIMGIKQFQKLDAIVESRNQIKNQYLKKLAEMGFKEQAVLSNTKHNVQSLVFTVPENIERDALQVFLKQAGIETTLGTYCLSATTFYQNKYDCVQKNALWLENNTLTFPCHDEVNVDFVAAQVKKFVKTQSNH